METHEMIKLLREKNGLSQEALALAVGYTSRSSIAKIEAGLVDLSESKIAAFAKALHTTPANLMGLEKEKESETAPLGKNIVRIIGRNGLNKEIEFSDEEIKRLESVIDLMFPYSGE